MKKHIIRLHPLGKEIRVNDQTPLIDVLHEYGIEFPCGGKGVCGKCKVRLLDGEIGITEEHREKIKQLGLTENWRLACMSRCTGDIALEVEQFNQLILADESKFSYQPKPGYGIAIDLGTTTLVCQLVELSTARILAVETGLNPQIRFGADLISRIQACLDGHAGELTRNIRIALEIMIARLLKKHPVTVSSVALVGNTAMQLIFSGEYVGPLASYPFETGRPASKCFLPEELDWHFPVQDTICFLPFIGSFVGSDILAGIAATGLHLKEKYTALIDLGTNGEIALGNRQRIVCASTAAGPAFEGANISMGMRAVTGAISSMKAEKGAIKASVIGNTAPKGICGSALVDAVALLRKQGAIGMFGEIISGEEQLRLAGKVFLNQKDIQEFLLAKAALATGLYILARHLSIRILDIDRIYIAGGFGNYLNLSHVVSTGMIELTQEKISKMGNTALIGAKMFLFTGTEPAQEILTKTKHIHLESEPDFQDIFISKMLLENEQ
ncbi:MAG: ASKHA domain-containing protein [Mangrovibacterium sp.]